MTESTFLQKCKLSRNPFPPAAAGLSVGNEEPYVPETWKRKAQEYYNFLRAGQGPKAFPVIGEYGSGKTVLLTVWLRKLFEQDRIRTFYFENPGVGFYDLANSLMRGLGRYEFSKALWERCKEYLDKELRIQRLFPMSYGDWLSNLQSRMDRERMAKLIQSIIRDNLGITDDEEVAYKMALLIVETAVKPFFEYHDFVAGAKTSLVPEREEAIYFKAIIKSIIKVYDVKGVAFLIDEFEEVSISKRIPARKSYDYLATIKRLINLSEKENLWIVLAMTPDGAKLTSRSDPALWERFTQDSKYQLELNPLSVDESVELLKWWLDTARISNASKGTLFPFPENLASLLKRDDLRLPRTLVRIGFTALSDAEQTKMEPPLAPDFVKKTIERLYPEKK